MCLKVVSKDHSHKKLSLSLTFFNTFLWLFVQSVLCCRVKYVTKYIVFPILVLNIVTVVPNMKKIW